MKFPLICLTLAFCTVTLSPVFGQSGPDVQQLQSSRKKALDFLKSTQSDDGTWSAPNAVGITSLVVYGMMQSGLPTDDPSVAAALKKIASFSNENGSIASSKSRHVAYETAVAVMALSAANQTGSYDKILVKAEKFLRGAQFDESKDIEKSDIRYGGIGYTDKGSRPDLSNTVFCMEALKATGAGADDPAIQKALVFISRCQNLESEHNTSPFAAKVNDGGFFYTAADGGSSAAGKTDEGGLRSYGSMTYGGLRSMVYAGLTAEDQRVKAAHDWISKNYTVESNPGMGPNGLFYYYQLFGKALAVLEMDTVIDESKTKHDWRKELSEKLFSIQSDSGSWVNTQSDRWLEGDPHLVTAYALIALSCCDSAN